MTNAPRKYLPKTRGKTFKPGDPGKPKGARHKTRLGVSSGAALPMSTAFANLPARSASLK